MRDRVLLFDAHLGERTTVALNRYEHRVIGEAGVATLTPSDEAFDNALGRDLCPIWPKRERDGSEASSPIVDALELG